METNSETTGMQEHYPIILKDLKNITQNHHMGTFMYVVCEYTAVLMVK